MSDSGRATGYTYDGTKYYSFRSHQDGYLTDPESCVHHSVNSLIYMGINVSIGFDMDQSGSGPIRVVGDLAQSGGHWRAFLYYEDQNAPIPAKAAVLLPEPMGAGESSARAVVPASGTGSYIVGYAGVNARFYACYWLAYTNGYMSLENLGTTYFSTRTNSYAMDIYGNWKVGYYNSGSDSSNVGFIIDGTNVYNLNVISATATAALGINANGQIVGYAVQSGYTKPVLWEYQGGGSYDVTILSQGNYYHGMARGINDSGVIVGSVWNTAYPSTGYNEKACHWTTGGAMTTLDSYHSDSTLNFIRAYKVGSATGKPIVGFENHDSHVRAFLFQDW